LGRTWFADRIGMGRDYYYPYRVMLPLEVENLIIAGRHFSATSEAQRMSREIPPMFVMGQAAGTAAALSIRDGTPLRRVDVGELQETLRRQGAYLGADHDPAPAATEKAGAHAS
jgi:FAD dependent oxidoreductase